MPSILLVSDDSSARDTVKAAAERTAHTLSVCSPAGFSPRSITHAPPDTLVLDTDLPGPLRDRVLREIVSARSGSLRIIVLCSVVDRGTVLRLATMGVRQILVKSSDLERLLTDRLTAEPAAAAPSLAAAPERSPPVAAPAEPESPAQHPAPTSLTDLRPIVSRSELIAQLDQAAELSAMGPVVREVISLSNSASASMDSVAAAIKKDPVLSLKVLKLANSAAFSVGDRADTVHKAVLRIGVAQTREAVLAITVIDQFGPGVDTGGLRVDWFWEHCLATGIAAKQLAAAMGFKGESLESAFSAGLFHDMGRMILASAVPALYRRVLDAAHALNVSPEAAEGRLLILNHSEIGEMFLRKWKFSEQVLGAVRLHQLSLTDIAKKAGGQLRWMGLLALADRVAHGLCLGHSGNPFIYDTTDLFHTLEVPAAAADSIWREVREQTGDLRLAMLAHSTEMHTDSVIDPLRKRLGQAFTPLYISSSPATDAFAAFHANFPTPTESLPPSVAVVHIPLPRDAAAVRAALAEREKSLGAKPTPIVVITPLTPAAVNSLFPDRPCRVLAAPFSLQAWERAMTAPA